MALLLMSVLHSYRNPVGLQLRLVTLEECFAGGEASFVMELINPDARPRYDIELRSSKNFTAMVNVVAYEHMPCTAGVVCTTPWPACTWKDYADKPRG